MGAGPPERVFPGMEHGNPPPTKKICRHEKAPPERGRETGRGAYLGRVVMESRIH